MDSSLSCLDENLFCQWDTSQGSLEISGLIFTACACVALACWFLPSWVQMEEYPDDERSDEEDETGFSEEESDLDSIRSLNDSSRTSSSSSFDSD